MEIVIIGAGAMGGLFGLLLAPWAEVCLYTTNAVHAQIINRDGLTLIAMDGTIRRAGIRVLTDLEQYDRRADLILLCTKARSTDEAARAAQRVLAEDGLVLSLQNGLGNLERISRSGRRRSEPVPASPLRRPPCWHPARSAMPAVDRLSLPLAAGRQRKLPSLPGCSTGRASTPG